MGPDCPTATCLSSKGGVFLNMLLMVIISNGPGQPSLCLDSRKRSSQLYLEGPVLPHVGVCDLTASLKTPAFSRFGLN